MAPFLRGRVKAEKKDRPEGGASQLPELRPAREEKLMAKRDVSTGVLSEKGGVAARILAFVLLAALVLILAKLFAVQNAASVTVWFYNWKFTAALADVV